MTRKKHLLTYITMITVVLWISVGCEDDPNPIYVPPSLTLDIFFQGGVPQGDIDENLALAAQLTDVNGNQQPGYRLRVTVDPDSIGNIAPTGLIDIDPQTETGLTGNVVFIGRKYGNAIIQAEAMDGSDIVSTDTLNVVVRPPGNEE
ncbi:MAG: hypothetical protein P9M15_03995 [Candidatus Electryoneaceae bacterium]|nr:hypothetical protein [Candidatus Electryoneaceae bacterium]